MTRPAMTGQQAEALATFLVSLRPGQRRWTRVAVMDALIAAAVAHTPDAETLARAAIRAALTPSIVGPEVIPMPGAHWESVNHAPAHEGVKGARHDCGGIHMPGAPCIPSPVDMRGYIATLRDVDWRAKRPRELDLTGPRAVEDVELLDPPEEDAL